MLATNFPLNGYKSVVSSFKESLRHHLIILHPCCHYILTSDQLYWRVTAAVHMGFSILGIVILTFHVGGLHMKQGFFNPLGLEEGRSVGRLSIVVLDGASLYRHVC